MFSYAAQVLPLGLKSFQSSKISYFAARFKDYNNSNLSLVLAVQIENETRTLYSNHNPAELQ